jgi:hypothetical protein
LEDTPRPILIKSPVVIQTPSVIVGRAMVVKQLEAPSQIETAMEALVNQMSQSITSQGFYFQNGILCYVAPSPNAGRGSCEGA